MTQAPWLAQPSLCALLVTAILVNGPAHASASSCPSDSKTVTLDRDTFGSDLNNALYRSPRGLSGKAGTVQVPSGEWSQRGPVLVHSCQRILGTGPNSKLMFSNNGYLISNSVHGTDQAGSAVGANGAVMADNVEIGNLAVVFSKAGGGLPYHRAIVFGGWAGPEEYVISGLQLHDLQIFALSGIALSFVDHAVVTKNTVTGIRDFSDRCGWKARQSSLHPEAGIVLGRGVTNTQVLENTVRNVGAEGITIDISTADPALIKFAPEHNTIMNNVVRRVGRSGIDVNGGNFNRLEGNTIAEANQFHLRVGNSAYIRGGHDNQFINNSVTGYGVLVAVSAATNSFPMPSTGNVVSKNQLTYLGLGTGADDTSVKDCGITENFPDYGAVLSGAPETTWTDNTIVNKAPRLRIPAVYVRQAQGHTFSGNTIEGFNATGQLGPFYIFEAPGNATVPGKIVIHDNTCRSGGGEQACPAHSQ